MKRTVQQSENYNHEALRGRCIMYVHIKTGIAGIHVGIRWVNKRKMKRRIKNWNICWTQIADALIFLRCCCSHMLQLRHDFTAHPIMICSSLLLIKDPLTKFMPQRIYVNALNHVQTFMEHPMHGCINSNGSVSLAVCRHAKKVMQQKHVFLVYVASIRMWIRHIYMEKTLKSFEILSRSSLRRTIACSCVKLKLHRLLLSRSLRRGNRSNGEWWWRSL